MSTTQGVLVVNASGHLAYANSVQMLRNGVDASTTAEGVMKDAEGEPTGEFHETAMALVFDDMACSPGMRSDAIRDGGELLRQAGVTTGSDMALFAAGDAFDTYARVANEPAFPVRVFYSPHVSAMANRFSSDELLAHLASLRDQGNDRYGLGPLKLIADGSIQGFTGKLKWPGYCGGEDHGFLILDEDAVVGAMTPFHEAGYQMAIHTNGDEATEVVLRAIDRVLQHSPRRDHRHRLEHCQMASRAMMRRWRTSACAPTSSPTTSTTGVTSTGRGRWARTRRARMDAASTRAQRGASSSRCTPITRSRR